MFQVILSKDQIDYPEKSRAPQRSIQNSCNHSVSKKNQIILCLWLKSRLFAKQIIIRIVMIHLGITMLYSLWYSINVHYHNLLYLLKGRNGKHYEGQISHIIDLKFLFRKVMTGETFFLRLSENLGDPVVL